MDLFLLEREALFQLDIDFAREFFCIFKNSHELLHRLLTKRSAAGVSHSNMTTALPSPIQEIQSHNSEHEDLVIEDLTEQPQKVS